MRIVILYLIHHIYFSFILGRWFVHVKRLFDIRTACAQGAPTYLQRLYKGLLCPLLY